MKLRVSRELYERLKGTSETYSVDMADIMRRALRKWRRLQPRDCVVPARYHDGTTYRGPVLTMDLQGLDDGVSPEGLRSIINWYLDSVPAEPDRFIPTLREGVDYLVEASA